ncbi:uncharacterized protein LOC116179670 isoform X2 [Photinus pyralis]|uniref:uncharacterized protein LOC116179670 isoform X2 n=1 Tax=Photinus pyralis TaxID=7054 RepID=UPI001266E7C7|nr:uncharacterized protein LOC116179670 isoform X2 [Photinus pyralis]
MIGLIFCLQILLSFSKSYDPDVCSHKGEMIYHLLGCTPVKEKPSDPCASRFVCPTGNMTDPSGCLASTMGVEQTSSRGNNSCNGVCRCMEETLVTCPILKCPEFNREYCPSGCYNGYDIDGCCSTGHICLSPRKDTHVCRVDGYAYKEGQKFFPSDSCKVCVCHKDFKGKYVEPFCKFLSCEIRDQFSYQLSRNCAPVYKNERALCCPYTWLCPNTVPTLRMKDEDYEMCFWESRSKRSRVLFNCRTKERTFAHKMCLPIATSVHLPGNAL